MSQLYRVKEDPHYEGVPLPVLESIDWKTNRVIHIDNKSDCSSRMSLKNKYLSIQSKNKAVEARKSYRIVKFEAFCMFTLLTQALLIPYLGVYYGISDSSLPGWGTRKVFLLINNMVVTTILFADTYMFCKRGKKKLALEMLNPSNFLCTIPWGVIFSLLGFSSTVVVAGCMFVYARLYQFLTRYTLAVEKIGSWYAPRSPAPLRRLSWLFVTVLIILNVFGSTYFYLGSIAEGYSWLDYDNIREDNSTRISEDPMNRADLRYARSTYFIFQTLLTVGYGDVAPFFMYERMFGAVLCLLGVFLLAQLIANMQSYLVNMDAAPTAHKTNSELVERVMTEGKVPFETKHIVRKALGEMWKTGKGLTQSQIFRDLPPTVVDMILNSQVRMFSGISLFKGPDMSSTCRPVAYYILQYLRRVQIPPGEKLFPSKQHVSIHGNTLIVLLAGTAKRSDEGKTYTKKSKKSSNGNILGGFTGHRGFTLLKSFSRSSMAGMMSTSPHSGSRVHPSTSLSESNSVVPSSPANGKFRKSADSMNSISSLDDDSLAHSRAESSGGPDRCSNDPEAVSYRACFPMLIGPGQTLGSASFFGCFEHGPPDFRAVTTCEVLYLSHAQLRMLSYLFPEWGMKLVVDCLGSTLSGAGIDPRVDKQLQSEQPGISGGTNKRADTRLRKIRRLKKQDTRRLGMLIRNQKKKFKRNGVADIAWDTIIMLVILYNSILIPMRLAGMNSPIMLSASLPFTIIDLLGDIMIVANRFLKPLLFKAVDVVNTSRAAAMDTMLVHNTVSPKGRKTQASLDQNMLQKVIAAEEEEKRRQQWVKWLHYLRVFAETALLGLSFFSFLYLLTGEDEKSVKQTVTLLRVPFLIRTFMVVELYTLLIKHYVHFQQERASKRSKSANTARDAASSSSEIESRFLSAKLSIWFMLSAHWIACYGMVIVDSSTRGIGDQYVLGLYWSLTTMTTVGFGDISPTTGMHSLYTSLFAVLGVAVYSILVSLIGTFLKDVEVSPHNVGHHRACLTSYLIDREISSRLQAKVWHYLDYVEVKDLVVKQRVLGLHPPEHVQVPRAFVWRNSGQERGETFSFKKMSVVDRIFEPVPKESDYLPALERSLVIREMSRDSLLDCTLFKGVSLPFISELCGMLSFEVVCPDQVVVSKTHCEPNMYIVKEGKLEEKSENNVKIRELTPGSSFNESSLELMTEQGQIVDIGNEEADGASVNTIVAMETSQLWVVERRALIQLRELYPADIELVMESFKSVTKRTNVAASNLRKGGKLGKLTGDTEDVASYTHLKSRRVFDADSKVQVNWNALMFFVLLYNLVLFPLRIAFFFNLDLPVANYALDYVFDVLLIVDVFLRLRHFQLETSRGERISEPELFRRYYMRSLFGLGDILSAIPVDFVFMVMVYVLRSGPSALTYLPVLRTNKLMRGVRIIHHITAMGKNIKNQNQKSLVTITKLVLTLLLVAHWTGCIFYLIARKNLGDNSASGSWVDASHMDLLVYNKTVGKVEYGNPTYTWADHYLISLYFAVATVTAVGYGDIYPVSMFEIGYTIIILVVGGILYSVIIAYLEDIVAQADLTSILYQQKTDRLTTYASLQRLPSLLKQKIKVQMNDWWLRQKGVSESSVLQFLNPGLRREVILELLSEATFRRCPVLGPSGCWTFVVDKLEVINVPAQTTVFEAGEIGSYLYFVVDGCVNLMSGDRNTVYSTIEKQGTLGQDGFFRENEGYHSTARSQRDSVLARLKLDDLLEVLKGFPSVRQKFLAEHKVFVEKPSLLAHIGKNFDKRKLTKMLARTQSEEAGPPATGIDKYILFPSTAKYTVWHMIVLLVTLYNSVVIPLMLGSYRMSEELSHILLVLDVFADIILYVHLVMSATVVSRVVNGLVLRTSAEIKKSYLMTRRGFFDICSALPVNYIILIVTGDFTRAYYGRALRLYWLLSLSELWGILDSAIDASDRVNIRTGYRHLVRIVVAVLLTSHWLACCHLSLIYYSREEPFPESETFAEAYVNSLYLIIYTMTTVGYGNSGIQNNAERFFSMFVMILGAFLCDAGITSTLVSIIDIEDYNTASSNRYREGAVQYVQENQLPPNIADHVAKFYDFKQQLQGLRDAEIIRQFNPSLALQVTGYLIHRSMGKLPEHTEQLVFFSPGMLRTLLLRMSHTFFTAEDILFHSGETISKLVFVVQGEIKVHLRAPAVFTNDDNVQEGVAPETELEDDRRGSLTRSYTIQSQERMKALVALENTEDDSRCVFLSNPGLILPNRKFGARTKETVICKSVCSTWVADRDLYKLLQTLQPSVGGFFRTLPDMLGNSLAAKCFSKFLERDGEEAKLAFILAVDQYKAASGDNMRLKKASNVVSKHLDMVELPSNVKMEIIENYKGCATNVFQEAYSLVLASLEKDLERFKLDPAFQEMAIELHERRRAKEKQ